MLRTLSRRTLVIGGGGAIAIGGAAYLSSSTPTSSLHNAQSRRPPPPWTPPVRQTMLEDLKSTPEFDLLIVGGGATGAGVAVDAATRGLKVALVERDDFSSGTSSKSTKLVHGGVRYLQKAVMEFDYEQFKLVKEALHERKIFLQTAPYLSHSLPIMLPLYRYWQMPYYWAGCKLYDMLAGGENMESSYIMSKGKALEAFPMLKGDGLVGAVVYYDGQHNDARMNVALIMTAVLHGATIANYAEVTALHKNASGRLTGATIRNKLTDETFTVRAKGIINATGPFSDTLLTLASDKSESQRAIVQPSSGVHITLPNYYSPGSLGLIDPQTSDGRVIFFLPWQGNTIAGTTDTPARVERNPVPKEEDIQWILEEIRTYLSPDIKVRRGDVLSAWSGLRPLVRDPSSTKSGTEGLVRNHLINVSKTGLLTIAGGKWTTYRAMAAETIDRAIEEFGLDEHVKNNGKCITEHVRLVGSDGWTPNMFISLIQRVLLIYSWEWILIYRYMQFGLETDVAKHLAMNYGDRAWTVCSYLKSTSERWPVYGVRVSPQYPYIEAEIRYAVHHEYSQTAIDFLSRRSRLSFLNAQAALEALPRVIDIMAEELHWDRKRRRQEYARATDELMSMGIQVSQFENPVGWTEWALNGFGLNQDNAAAFTAPTASRSIFSIGEIDSLRQTFLSTVTSSVSQLPKSQLGAVIREMKGFRTVKDKQIDYVMREAGLEGRIALDMDEFIEVCAVLKEVVEVPQPIIKTRKTERRRIPVEKSGGGI